MDTRPAMTVGQSHDDESAWALDHAEDVALEATGGPWPDILDEYGSMDVWLDHCRRQRHRDGGDRNGLAAAKGGCLCGKRGARARKPAGKEIRRAEGQDNQRQAERAQSPKRCAK